MIQRLADKLYYRRLRAAAGSTAFAIVSNNCWGAHFYQQLNLPYSTPFVGLFLRPACYLTLLGDFDRLVHGELKFTDQSRYPDINARRATSDHPHPIAVLADAVEVHFLHEKTEADARDKWKRRASRVPEDPRRRFFKFCDFDRPTVDQLRDFDTLPLAHKVFFTAKPIDAQSAIVVASKDNRVPDGMALQTACLPYFDHAAWLAGRDPRPRFSYRLLQTLRCPSS